MYYAIYLFLQCYCSKLIDIEAIQHKTMSVEAQVSSILAISRRYHGEPIFFKNFLPALAGCTLNDRIYCLLDNIVAVSFYGANIAELALNLAVVRIGDVFAFVNATSYVKFLFVYLHVV